MRIYPFLLIFDQNLIMPAIDVLRDRLIDKLLTIQDEGLLRALDQLLRSKMNPEEKVKITEAQRRMLQLSEDDIKYGRTISQDQMDQEDLDWLDEQ